MSPIKSILTAVDFSMCSSDAFRQAARIAAWNKAKLHVLHVVKVPTYQPALQLVVPFDLPSREDIVRDAKRRWADLAPGAEGKADAEFSVVFGSPRAEILRAVDTIRPDLLVMGTNSGSDRNRGIGSIAAAAVRRAEAMVLLVRDEQTKPYASVAACIDFTATSRVALEQAIRVAAQDEAVLHVMHMYDDPWYGMPRPGELETSMSKYNEQIKEAVVKRLQEFCEPMANTLSSLKVHYHGIQNDEHWSGHGDGLVRFIRLQGVDLVVLGVRSSWNTRDILWGSTASRVCRDASCSILTVRPAREE